MIRSILAAAAAVMCAASASAQTLVPIHLTGDPDTRINYVIMADGFTAAEMDAFRTAANGFKDFLLGASPYVRYADHFNVYRLEINSNASGVSRPGAPVDTALGSELGCFNIARLLCANNQRANAALTAADPTITFHIRLIVANTTEYGGGGGFYATTTLNEHAPSVFQHEIGHSFASLNDEYVDANICAQQPGLYGPPGEINSSAQSTRTASPWAMWIDAATPVPTTDTADAQPGMYEGGHYCPTGVWRPTYNSLMRTLNRPMEQINTEQFVRVFNRTAPGMDGANPAPGPVTMTRNGRIRFSVIPKTIDDQAFGVTWRVNGNVVQSPAQTPDGIGFAANGTRYTFHGVNFAPGTYQVTATVRDVTSLVRNDPAANTTHEMAWTVTVENRDTPAAVLAGAVLPFARSVTNGTPATAFASFINSGSAEATNCTMSLQRANGTASPATFSYQATNPSTNVAQGALNPSFSIPAGGTSTFVFSAQFAATTNSAEVFPVANCANSDAAPRGSGVNSMIVSSSPTAQPDIVSISATIGTPGVAGMPTNGTRTAVALSAVNIGAAGDVTLRADLGAGNLPVEVEMCETNPVTGQCLGARTSFVTVNFAQNQTRTFAAFLRAHGPVQFAPERYRMFFVFEDGGRVRRGGTNVAVRTVE
ncbi:MAG: hypothetical protein CMF74_06460 [Maricaulis sp.]|jgi:hypothetical protein|nr:hypothetical protein [Maricaulis sp.]HAQ35225.1 hypothetical protein [Alphaproteobacteria bacterium]